MLAGDHEFTFPDDSTVTGTGVIGWLPGADTTLPAGPQVGSGKLVGSSSGDGLLIQFNPISADNNVALNAVPSAERYAGHWVWTTFTRPRFVGALVIGRE